MSGNEEPDWLAELAKGGDEVRRQIELLVQGARQFVHGAEQAPAVGGPVPPFQQRVVRAVGAAVRELAPARQPVRVHLPLVATVSAAAAVTPVVTITGTGSVALPRMRFSGQGTVENPPRCRAALSDGEIVFLVLVWLYAVWLPWVGSRLPPELHAMLSDSYGTIAIALAITWRLLDKRK
jgi:hypothetical protein